MENVAFPRGDAIAVCLLNIILFQERIQNPYCACKKKNKILRPVQEHSSYPFSFCIPCYRPEDEFTDVRNSNRKDFTNDNKQITLNIHITLKSRGIEN